MTTQAFSADSVKQFPGTAADAVTGTMSILMKTNRYYTDNSLLQTGNTYTVTTEWGRTAVERGWASDVGGILPITPTPAGLTATETAAVQSLVSPEGNPAPMILVQTGIPFILGSSGTIGDSGGFGGALTYTTALPVAYGWSYCYFPADAVLAGSAAGWWLTNMTSTTAGVVYDYLYPGGQPSIPSSPTRVATGSPGAYTQTTGASDIPAITAVIPAGAMGPNGAIAWDQKRVALTSANNKQFSTLLGGQIVCAHTVTTAQLISGAIGTIHNRGTALAQVSVQTTFGDPSSGSMRRQTVDTTAAQVFAHAMYLINAAEYAVLEGASIILRPKT